MGSSKVWLDFDGSKGEKMKTFALILSLIVVMVFPVSIVRAEGGDLSDRPAQLAVTNPALGNDPRVASVLDSEPALIEGDGAVDHRAKVFEFEGDVRILKAGADEWMPAEKEMVLEAGDQILTGKGSFVDIVYDDHFLNVARIDAETKAEFRSIEPTELHLEDGKIFSALDGLAPGDGYRISTPTAVAGVRGTTFDVMHNAQTKLDIINVYPDSTPHLGEVFVEPAEGKALSITEGEGFSEGKVGEIPEKDLETAQDFRETIETSFDTDRQEGFEVLKTLRPEEVVSEEPLFESKEPVSASDMETRIDSMLDEALTPSEDFSSQPQEVPALQEKRGEKNEESGETQDSALKTTGDKNQPANSKPDMGAMMNFIATGGASQPGTTDSAEMKKVDFGGMMTNLGFRPDVSEKFGGQLNDMTARGMDMTHFIGTKDVTTAPMSLPMPEMKTETAMMDRMMPMDTITKMMGAGTDKTMDTSMMQTLMQEVIFRPDQQMNTTSIQDFMTINKITPETRETILSFLDHLRTNGAGRVFNYLQGEGTLLPTALGNTNYVNNPVPNPIALVTTENTGYELKIYQIRNGAQLPTDNVNHNPNVAVVNFNIMENGNSVGNVEAVCSSTSCTKVSET